MRNIFLVAIVFLASSCFMVSKDEVSRVLSPDGSLEAILVEDNGGATTSFGYNVYIVKTGSNYRWAESAASLYGAIRNEHAYGVNLKWTSPDALNLEFLSARDIHHYDPTVLIGNRTIQVNIREGIADPNAPPGGMLYNKIGLSYPTKR
jgi:hypothetical protein